MTPLKHNDKIKLKEKVNLNTGDNALAKPAVSPENHQHFYDFYLSEHQSMACRRLHFLGSSFGVMGAARSLQKRSVKPLMKGIAAGYACAWVGHFFFEKNKPATFKYPLQSFQGDLRMFYDVLAGNISLKDKKLDKKGKKSA